MQWLWCNDDGAMVYVDGEAIFYQASSHHRYRTIELSTFLHMRLYITLSNIPVNQTSRIADFTNYHNLTVALGSNNVALLFYRLSV